MLIESAFPADPDKARPAVARPHTAGRRDEPSLAGKAGNAGTKLRTPEGRKKSGPRRRDQIRGLGARQTKREARQGGEKRGKRWEGTNDEAGRLEAKQPRRGHTKLAGARCSEWLARWHDERQLQSDTSVARLAR